MNIIKLTKPEYELILSKFPEYARDMLRIYTGEELFYVYKLCCFKPIRDKHGDLKSGDVFYLAMKAKMIAYLLGKLDQYSRSIKPIHPNAWGKLGSKFRYEFNQTYTETVELATQEQLDKLYAKTNAQRIA